jgi:hypothetical protein
MGVDARAIIATVVWWKPMFSAGYSTHRLIVAVAVCSVPLAIGTPAVSAAPPTTDGQGYVDSTARCAAPATAVVFGSTDLSRVAICSASGGQYEYRGVRVSDGAKLIVPASQSGSDGFVAENDGVTYLVTAKSLTVSLGNKVIRDEPMVDFHRPEAPAAPAAPPPTTTSTTPLPPPLAAEVGGGR